MYWDPSPDLVTLPLINHPIRWYGVFFVLGFLISFYRLILPLTIRFNGNKQQAIKTLDSLTWHLFLGTVIGARLGHILFYELPHYIDYPFDLFKIWQGGLASHGGACGVLIALYIFSRKHTKLSYIEWCDLLVPSAALIGVCIRIGNFFNQEIIGPITTMPWGISFGHPTDGLAFAPRHPVQLYEAFAYLLIFLFLSLLTKKKRLHQGVLTGLFFLLVFSSRFILEWFKSPLSRLISEETISMGQILSLPFILLGIWLIVKNRCISYTTCKKKEKNG